MPNSNTALMKLIAVEGGMGGRQGIYSKLQADREHNERSSKSGWHAGKWGGAGVSRAPVGASLPD